MDSHRIVYQHALRKSLEHIAEKSSFHKWSQEAHETPNVDRQRLTAVLEAASSDPIGLHLLARRVIHGETYQQAVGKLAAVTSQKISPADARQRVCRLQQRIKTSILE